MLIAISTFIAFILDQIFGDPRNFPHPVVIIGKGISFLEKHLRRIFPNTPTGKKSAGAAMAILIPLTTFVITAGICVVSWIIHPLLFFAIPAAIALGAWAGKR